MSINAQDIKQTVDALSDRLADQPIKMTGGINSFLGFNYASGIDQRIDPFRWRFIGYANVDLLGINIPASLIFSTRSTVFNYTLPAFSFAGLSPTYKWATLHLGDRNMNLGRYSLSGQSFRGVGTELKPGNFRFKAMFGRLRRSRAEEIGVVQNVEPAFKRLGWGLQSGYDNGRDHLLITLFKAWDQRESIPQIVENPNIRPGENIILSALGRKRFGQKITLQLDVARSALTTDISTPELSGRNGLFETVGGLLKPRVATGYYWAVKTDLDIKTGLGQFKIGHEWIEPGYVTMGSLFFNNDVERFTGGWSHRILNRIQIRSLLGLERNNLSSLEINTYSRLVGSVNMNFAINERLNVAGNYSNFSSTNRLKSFTNPLSAIDTIVLAQVNKQASLQANYRFNNSNPTVLTCLLSWQDANNIQNDVVQTGQGSQFLVGSISLSWQKVPRNLTLIPGMTFQRSESARIQNLTWGPSLIVTTKTLGDLLSIQGNINFLAARIDSVGVGHIINISGNAAYQLNQKQNLGLHFSLVDRLSKISSQPTFSEWRLSLQYGWKF